MMNPRHLWRVLQYPTRETSLRNWFLSWRRRLEISKKYWKSENYFKT